MKIASIIMCLFIFLDFCTQGNCDVAKKTVLIPPFENLSSAKSIVSYEVATNPTAENPKRYFTIDRYSEAPRGLVEDVLVNMGTEVVERQRVDQLILEAGAVSGLFNTENAIKLGKMLGANTIIMGSILNIQSRQSTFSGYGIKTKGTTYICSIRIRAIDIENGVVTFSKVYVGQVIFQKSGYGDSKDSDPAYTAIEDSIKMMAEDTDFRNLFEKGIV